MFPCINPRMTGRQHLLGLVSVLMFALFLLAGCGGGSDNSEDSVVLATVGDRDVTAQMYKDGLLKMEEKDLPVNENGPVDTSSLAGKKEFLKVLINKELLGQKALQLGYEKDPQAIGARASLTAYHGGLALWEDVIGNPANTITEEELAAFYENMGTTRTCLFVICNFLDDAEKARDFARTGADWEEVVKEYHDGAPAPSGKYEIPVPFGQYSSSFEDGVFEAAIGDVTDPVRTSYGYWVMRVVSEKQADKPALEDAKARILDITRNRKIGRARNDFKEQIRKDHKLFIDESVLWTCFQGIPEGGLLDPETNQPRAKEDLAPLNVPLSELGQVFYTYELKGELVEQTLGDYKGHFDNMSVFQRPKKTDMLGGLREHLIQELERGIVNEEAEKRGFYEDPKVLAQVDEKVEEVMVTKLYGDVVQFDDRVSSEQLDEFYQEHLDDFFVPENRAGLLVVCLNESEAAQAKADMDQGKPWKGILNNFGSDRENKSKSGRVSGVSARQTGPLKDAMFSLEEKQISEPFPFEDGRFGVIKLEKINPSRQIEKSEASFQIGQSIKSTRKEEAFQALLTKWSNELGVIEFEDKLATMPSWQELRERDVPENLVPRN